MVSITFPDGSSYQYSYDSTTNLLSSTISATGITTNYSYDSKGNPLATSIAGSDGHKLQSETTYEADGSMTKTVTTGSRQTTTYTNDTERSLVTAVEDANGNTTATAYDTLRRPTTVTSGSASVSYSYTDDRLTGIQHGSTNYTIAYAPGGQQASVSVGSRTLVSNTYDSNTRLLTKQTYGNNQSWNYIYDNTDTLICK